MILLSALFLMNYIRGQSGQPGTDHGSPGQDGPAHYCIPVECERPLWQRNCDCSYLQSRGGFHQEFRSWALANGYYGWKK